MHRAHAPGHTNLAAQPYRAPSKPHPPPIRSPLGYVPRPDREFRPAASNPAAAVSRCALWQHRGRAPMSQGKPTVKWGVSDRIKPSGRQGNRRQTGALTTGVFASAPTRRTALTVAETATHG